MSTTTAAPFGLKLFKTYRGYTIYRSYISKAGSERTCNTQQGWEVRHPETIDRYTLGTGFVRSLAEAERRINITAAIAYQDGRVDELSQWKTERIETLGRMFPDAPNPPKALALQAEAEKARSAKTEKEQAEAAAALRVRDAAPAMLAALHRIEWSAAQRCPCCGAHQDNGHTPACDVGAAIIKAEG